MNYPGIYCSDAPPTPTHGILLLLLLQWAFFVPFPRPWLCCGPRLPWLHGGLLPQCPGPAVSPACDPMSTSLDETSAEPHRPGSSPTHSFCILGSSCIKGFCSRDSPDLPSPPSPHLELCYLFAEVSCDGSSSGKPESPETEGRMRPTRTHGTSFALSEPGMPCQFACSCNSLPASRIPRA